jgi:hypothetical protein
MAHLPDRRIVLLAEILTLAVKLVRQTLEKQKAENKFL